MRPQVYRDVDLPETWDEWPEDARVNYLCTVMDRSQLLRTVGELATIPDAEIGEQSIHKAGLAHLVVVLQHQEAEDG